MCQRIKRVTLGGYSYRSELHYLKAPYVPTNRRTDLRTDLPTCRLKTDETREVWEWNENRLTEEEAEEEEEEEEE